MKNVKKNLVVACALLIVMSFTLVSCSQVKQLGGESTPSRTITSPLSKGAAPPQESLDTGETGTESGGTKTESKAKADRLIIRQKSLSMQVKDVRKTYKKIDQIASKYNGHITNASISSEEYPQDYYPITPETSTTPPAIRQKPSGRDDTGPLYATIIVKVPSDKVNAALHEVKKLGRVETERESEEEVTEQHTDLNARLKNLQRTEQRYLDFFNAAKTVEEMLKIEEQLSRVRGEIESLQAQISQLERSAQMATITVYLHEPAQVSKPIRDWGFVKAVLQGLENFVLVINFMVTAFLTVLPLIILILLVALAVWLILKKRQQAS